MMIKGPGAFRKTNPQTLRPVDDGVDYFDDDVVGADDNRVTDVTEPCLARQTPSFFLIFGSFSSVQFGVFAALLGAT